MTQQNNPQLCGCGILGIIKEVYDDNGKKRKTDFAAVLFSGLLFAVVEFIFSIYSHSQSALTDAVYDASELVFIALLLFLTPLFHKPVSEKHPYGYFQIESIFVLIKGVMMLSVTMGVSAEVLDSALSGGNPVNNAQISMFQCCPGVASVIIFLVMKRQNRNLSSPTIEAELLGWKLDIVYSLGMSLAFFVSLYLERTPLGFIAPYFDQIVAVIVMVFMIPESIRVLWGAVKDVFLFSPDKVYMEEVKAVCIAALYIKLNTGCMRLQAVDRREAEQGVFMSQEADQVYSCRQIRYPLLLTKNES